LVGLGNPGGEYKETRHNTGRIVLDHFCRAHDFEEAEFKKPVNALMANGEVAGNPVLIVEPETMMNNSGKSLIALVKSKKQAEQLVVIYDDMDLPLGTWKFAFDRGSGGHKGLESIMKALKTKAFVRVRVGVSPTSLFGKMKKPKGEDEVVKFILGKFSPGEAKDLAKVSKEIAQGLELLISEGLDRAMGEWNSKR
jgi:PTH1 family peptidyl-tRNA hydrolase